MTTKRGDCRFCNRSFALRKDGTLWTHVARYGDRLSSYGTGAEWRCQGSGGWPITLPAASSDDSLYVARIPLSDEGFFRVGSVDLESVRRLVGTQLSGDVRGTIKSAHVNDQGEVMLSIEMGERK